VERIGYVDYESIAALQEKTPQFQAEGLLKILMFSDGSGKIFDGPRHSDEGEPSEISCSS